MFDRETMGDAASDDKMDASPVGIEYVFVNGQKIVGAGKREQPLRVGETSVLRVPCSIFLR